MNNPAGVHIDHVTHTTESRVFFFVVTYVTQWCTPDKIKVSWWRSLSYTRSEAKHQNKWIPQKQADKNSYHCLMNWWRVGATSWGQTSPNRPIVMAVVKRKQEKQINKSCGSTKQKQTNQNSDTSWNLWYTYTCTTWQLTMFKI